MKLMHDAVGGEGTEDIARSIVDAVTLAVSRAVPAQGGEHP